MNKPELKDYLTKAFPSCTVEETVDFAVLRVSKEELFATAKALKEDDATRFDQLFCQTAVDYQPELEVVYHLHSTKYLHDMVLKVTLTDRDNAEVETVTPLWQAAEFFECEIFDLFGVRFTNFAGLRRLFMPEDWPGYPLRKDYTDDNIITR